MMGISYCYSISDLKGMAIIKTSILLLASGIKVSLIWYPPSSSIRRFRTEAAAHGSKHAAIKNLFIIFI